MTSVFRLGTYHMPPSQGLMVNKFPDGEVEVEIDHGYQGTHAVLVGDCATAARSEVLFAAAYGLLDRFALVDVIITYFRNARSERPSKSGALAMAKVQATMWSSLGPRVRIHLLDPHSDLIPQFFTVPTKAVSLMGLLLTEVDDYDILATVDEGRIHTVRELAGLGTGLAWISKQRLSGSKTRVLSVNGDDVAGKRVLIVDDMIATGSSLANAAAAYRERGAVWVGAVATHGVFCGPDVERHLRSLDAVWVSDTHPRAGLMRGVQVIPVVYAILQAMTTDVVEP